MKYKVSLNSREWEIIADDFDFKKYYAKGYDGIRLGFLTREAWQGNVPLYLHDVGIFSPLYLAEQARPVVTAEPVFSIFDKENLTFSDMVWEIWNRRQEIVKINKGDDNPYA